MSSRFTFENCSFAEEDDLSYLKNDKEWVDSRCEKLTEEEKEALEGLVNHLRGMETEMINNRFLPKVFKDRFSKEYLAKITEDKRKDKVKAIFMAAVVRELILRAAETNETVEQMQINRTLFLEKYPFLKSQEGTTTELTWLNRYERCLQYLAKILPANGNKQTYINIGANLEGSSVFVEYATGGANRPETQRRVDIYIQMTNIIPKARQSRTPRNTTSLKKKKAANHDEVTTHSVYKSSSKNTVGKRPRGRPRKYPLPEVTSFSTPKPTKKRPNYELDFSHPPLQTIYYDSTPKTGSVVESEMECFGETPEGDDEEEGSGEDVSDSEMELPFDGSLLFEGDFLLTIAEQQEQAEIGLDSPQEIPVMEQFSPPKPGSFSKVNSLHDFMRACYF